MVDIREQSPLSLAFVGDAVYSLAIREYLVQEKRYQINKLNKMTVNHVSAKGQFMALELIRKNRGLSAVAKMPQRHLLQNTQQWRNIVLPQVLKACLATLSLQISRTE